jgi:hypothetical protein
VTTFGVSYSKKVENIAEWEHPQKLEDRLGIIESGLDDVIAGTGDIMLLPDAEFVVAEANFFGIFIFLV